MAYLKIRPDLFENADTTKEASNIETITMHIAFLTLDRLASYEIKWPHKISNRKLYEKTGIRPLSQTIRERWKLLGHIMRLPAECPARRAMRYFFKERSNRKFPGRKRTTIVPTLNKDIQLAKSKHSSFPVTPLISQVSLQNLHTKAKNRKLWSNIVKQVVDAAYSS